MSQFYGGGKLNVELAKVRARVCALVTGRKVTDDEFEEEDFDLVTKLPMFSPPVPSSTSSSFLSSPPSPIFTSTSSITSTTFSSTTTRLSFLARPSTTSSSILVSSPEPVPASVAIPAAVPALVPEPGPAATPAPESVQVPPGNQCEKKTCAMKQPGEICEEPLCDQSHEWDISTDGLAEWTRVRQGPPPAEAPVPLSTTATVPEPREEIEPEEEVVLNKTFVPDVSEKKTLQACAIEQPRQIFGEEFLQSERDMLESAEKDVYESRTRILCEHGEDLECYECAPISTDNTSSIPSLAREVDRIAQRYPRIPPCPYPYVDWQALSRPSWKDRVGLPKPHELPILSCSPDPALSMPKPNMGIVDPFERPSYPFGTMLGYLTTMGPVAMPTVSVNGYSWCEEENAWLISASPPSRRRRGGRRSGERGHLRRGG